MTSTSKKQIPLRISTELFDELMKLSADDFRSINGEIEYILSDYVKKRKFGKQTTNEDN